MKIEEEKESRAGKGRKRGQGRRGVGKMGWDGFIINAFARATIPLV
jgi:hypothetical protein